MLVSDPEPLVPRGEDLSTLRLFMQTDPSEWRANVQQRNKSVWTGISAIGGFWTIADGIFALLFGVGLLFVFFSTPFFLCADCHLTYRIRIGQKPLGTFGLIHKLKPVPLPEYPRLKDEGTADPGLLQFIRDHFVDIEEDEEDTTYPAEKHPSTLR